MRISTVREHEQDDLTKKAQIVDAAILEFAKDGSKASVRAIATAAGVSPGLITHHFGSKDALRRECDDEVLRRYDELKLYGVADPIGAVGQVFDDPSAVSILVCYLIRSFLDGGDIAKRFMEQLDVRIRAVVDAALEKGIIKPSLNEDARVRYMTESSFGAAIVRFILNPPKDVTKAFATQGEGGGHDGSHDNDVLLAQVEVMTDGIFTDHSVFDALKARLENSAEDSEVQDSAGLDTAKQDMTEQRPPMQK